MRIVLQRVKSARVDVNSETIAQIGSGLVLLVGIADGDEFDDLKYLAEKCVNLRIFDDENGKMNIAGVDVCAEILAVPQFTLYADTRRGRRPGFARAAHPDLSQPLFDEFVTLLRRSGLKVETGRFGTSMQVHLMNDGPVTIILDSKDHTKSRRK
ncbi:MAG TPA: D-tyrosyl-tRNA(Tyr) deacylase [Bacteroidetes bacterium]|nr:D-tyrosyl-tRNA(Tyr) deacylase [Bacteroidota bacterium]